MTMARTEPIKIEFDTEALSRVADGMRAATAALEAALARAGRQEHGDRELRRKLLELADDMEGELLPGYGIRLREILEESMRGDHSGRSTEAEKTARRMEDVNQSTRPGERTLADVLKEQKR
jgi:hypothetical protein